MLKYATFLLLVVSFFIQNVQAQSIVDSLQRNKEYSSLEEALKNPEKVYRLNLSNQKFKLIDADWAKFTNLEYLSLKDDHLKEIPGAIGNIKTLKTLDLSGNDFKSLPSSFANLTNLQEVFLNDEKRFNFSKNVPLLSRLPNLKSLHLENDHLNKLPKNIFMLNQVESLYINNNDFKYLPEEVKTLKSLKFLDIHDNKTKFKTKLPVEEIDYGFKVRF
jgi:Leucine-rich repeat (LRR) protein